MLYRSVNNCISIAMDKNGWITKLVALRFFLGGFETYCIVPTAWLYIKSLDQTTFFLALVVSAYDAGAIIGGPLFGFMTDRLGNPRSIFICCCAMKIVAYVVYSINLSAYFPLFGRLVAGLGSGGTAILLGQIALQTDEESRGKSFVFLEGVYCLGSAFGPGIGSFITFRTNILGWEINEGNSPGIILSIIWLLFVVSTLFLPKDIWMETSTRHMELDSISASDDKNNKTLSECNEERRLTEYSYEEKLSSISFDPRIFCLFFLIFCSEAFSSTSTFYVPILALDHFHLQLFHIKLVFLNCTLFTMLVFICLHLASEYVEERKLFVFALLMQIIAISFLTSLAFSWDQVTSVQYYILLIYVCLGMPYFAYPFANSILSKITDAQNATFIQGLSYATLHLAIVISRIGVSFVFTKMSLLFYCFGMVILWLVGAIWFGILNKRMVPNI